MQMRRVLWVQAVFTHALPSLHLHLFVPKAHWISFVLSLYYALVFPFH